MYISFNFIEEYSSSIFELHIVWSISNIDKIKIYLPTFCIVSKCGKYRKKVMSNTDKPV